MNLCLILGDQLSESIATLRDIKPTDIILMCEVQEEATYVKHHPKKIAFLFAAMRHFAAALKDKGLNVRYIKLDEPGNSGSFTGEIARAIKEIGHINKIIVTEPGEYRVKQMFDAWQSAFALPVEIREDTRFLCSIAEFSQWAKNKKQLRMEFFYREMRKKHRILIEADGTPTGDQWNYDKDNRKPPTKTLISAKRLSHPKSHILQDVLTLVSKQFASHFGVLEPFYYAITRAQALLELNHFIEIILPHFGDYQDAMVKGEPYLNHSLLSSYLNAGLLLPLEICQMAETAYRQGKAPLNSVEGFIRQILGWREYIRGIYWHHMPQYGEMNYLQATTPLPDFYWGAKTHMACIREAVFHTAQHAYSHHIQRLMITGNFALIAGLDVKEIQAWYLAVYSDAYEWVEMPNTLGMSLYGDGRIVASKPYAASGKYIHRMSNFCKNCRYSPDELLGDNACPFNALYWDFMARQRKKLQGGQRLAYVYSTWDKFPLEKQNAIREKASQILAKMRQNTL